MFPSQSVDPVTGQAGLCHSALIFFPPLPLFELYRLGGFLSQRSDTGLLRPRFCICLPLLVFVFSIILLLPA